MLPGWAGGSHPTLTDRVLDEPEPHALFAVTMIVPPLEPTVTLIELVVELPLQPDGNVQV